jgi:hypothetical protein
MQVLAYIGMRGQNTVRAKPYMYGPHLAQRLPRQLAVLLRGPRLALATPSPAAGHRQAGSLCAYEGGSVIAPHPALTCVQNLYGMTVSGPPSSTWAPPWAERVRSARPAAPGQASRGVLSAGELSQADLSSTCARHPDPESISGASVIQL